jgi:hypothetical protein
LCECVCRESTLLHTQPMVPFRYYFIILTWLVCWETSLLFIVSLRNWGRNFICQLSRQEHTCRERSTFKTTMSLNTSDMYMYTYYKYWVTSSIVIVLLNVNKTILREWSLLLCFSTKVQDILGGQLGPMETECAVDGAQHGCQMQVWDTVIGTARAQIQTCSPYSDSSMPVASATTCFSRASVALAVVPHH